MKLFTPAEWAKLSENRRIMYHLCAKLSEPELEACLMMAHLFGAIARGEEKTSQAEMISDHQPGGVLFMSVSIDSDLIATVRKVASIKNPTFKLNVMNTLLSEDQ